MHVLLGMTVTHGVALPRTGTTERIVSAACIGHNLQQLISTHRHQLGSFSQVEPFLRDNGIARGIAIERIMSSIKQRIRSLISFHVHDSQHLPFPDRMHPVITGLHHFGKNRILFI